MQNLPLCLRLLHTKQYVTNSRKPKRLSIIASVWQHREFNSNIRTPLNAFIFVDIQTDYSINCYRIYLLIYFREWTKVFTIFIATISRVVEFRRCVCTVKRMKYLSEVIQYWQ